MKIMICNTITIFRQIDPSQNNALQDSQNQDVQKTNMRKVTVNAQVTAIISLSEMIGFILIYAITKITGKRTVAIILFRLFEFIVLPYAFLMNTRENKYRIVEEGWTNVFRNMLNSYCCSPPCNESTAVVSLSNHITNEPESDIYIISKQNRPKPRNTLENESFNLNNPDFNLNVPFEDKPSTSINFDFDENSEGNSKANGTSTGKLLDSKTTMSNMRSNILFELFHSINNETTYIRIFSRFVNLEEFKYEGNFLECESNEIVLQRIEKLLGKDNRLNRTDMRRKAIQKLQQSQQDETIYQNNYVEFVDMEEHFLDD